MVVWVSSMLGTAVPIDRPLERRGSTVYSNYEGRGTSCHYATVKPQFLREDHTESSAGHLLFLAFTQRIIPTENLAFTLKKTTLNIQLCLTVSRSFDDGEKSGIRNKLLMLHFKQPKLLQLLLKGFSSFRKRWFAYFTISFDSDSLYCLTSWK